MRLIAAFFLAGCATKGSTTSPNRGLEAPPLTQEQAIGVCGYRAVLFAAQNYDHDDVTDLATPHNDVKELARVLDAKFGFETEIHNDPSRDDMFAVLQRLEGEAKDCEAVLVYYAGHGQLAGEQGYWLPVDAHPVQRSNWFSTADVTSLVGSLDAQHILVVADSCYSGELFRSLPSRGPVEYPNRQSRWVITSGGSELVKDEYRDTGMSVFAYFLHQALQDARGSTLVPDAVFPKLRTMVLANADQTPEQGALRNTGHEGGQMIFQNKLWDSSEPVPGLGTEKPAESAGSRQSTNSRSMEDYGVIWASIDTSVCGDPCMVGSPESEEGRHQNEKLREVPLPAPFELMQTEVSQELWATVWDRAKELGIDQGGLRRNPSHFDGSALPVESVTWCEAVVFANLWTLVGASEKPKSQVERVYALSGGEDLTVDRCLEYDAVDVVWNREAAGYRLPTEEEWEIAARGGTRTAYWSGPDVADLAAVDWIHANSGGRTRPVSSAPDPERARRHPSGLIGVHGNVEEWTWNTFAGGPERAARGGTCAYGPKDLRIASRSGWYQGFQSEYFGFRLAKGPQPALHLLR